MIILIQEIKIVMFLKIYKTWKTAVDRARKAAIK